MSKSRTVALLLAALLLSRAIVLLAGIDSVFFDEELTTGLIAKDILEGLRTSFFDYQLADHHAGSLLMGLLAAPLFGLFGQSLAVLKLVPLALYAGAMVLWFECCDRYFGRTAAVLVSLMLICSPQLLTRFSLITVGFHPETAIFTAAAVLTFSRISFDGDRRFRWYAAFGLLCGFGSWFAYIFIPTAATCLIVWVLADPRLARRRGFAVFAFGVVIGGLPWLYFNATHHWGAFQWLVAANGAPGQTGWLRVQAFVQFLSVHLYRSFASAHDGPIQRELVSTLYVGMALAAYVSLFSGEARHLVGRLRAIVAARGSDTSALRPHVWFLLYPLVLAGFYAANTHVAADLGMIGHYGYEGFRYLFPLYPVLFVPIAIMLARLWEGRAPRAMLAAVAVAALCLTGLAANLQLLSSRNLGRALAYKPYSYKEFGFQRGANPPLSMTGMRDEDRRNYLLGRGWYVALKLEDEQRARAAVADTGVDIAVAEAADLRAAYRESGGREPLTTGASVLAAAYQPDEDGSASYFFYRAIGLSLVERQRGGDLETDLIGAVREVAALGLSGADATNAYAGLGTVLPLNSIPYYQFDETVGRYMRAVVAAAAHMPEPDRPAFFAAVGESIGVNVEFTILDKLDFVLATIDACVPAIDREAVYRGFGRGIGWRFGADPGRADDLIGRLRADSRPAGRAGLLEFLATLERY